MAPLLNQICMKILPKYHLYSKTQKTYIGGEREERERDRVTLLLQVFGLAWLGTVLGR